MCVYSNKDSEYGIMKEYAYTLDEIYERLKDNPDDKDLTGIRIYRSEVAYARAAIETATGIRLTLKEVFKLLQEEFNYKDIKHAKAS